MADLEALISQAILNDGLCDLQIRVSRYEAGMKIPACFQVITKYTGRMGGPWGVGMGSDWARAVVRALETGAPAAVVDKDIFA